MIYKSLLAKMQSTSGWLAGLTLLVFLFSHFFPANALEDNDQSETERLLIVKGDKYYPPFEFINENGEPDGFNVELFKAIADELGWKDTIILDSWSKVREEMESGRIDVILGLIYSPQRAEMMNFTIPHTVMTHGIFTHSSKDYRTIEELRGKEIVVQNRDIMHDYLIETGLTDKIITVANQQAALELIATGKHDAALIGNFQGMHLLNEYKFKNVTLRSSGIKPQKYAMAVKKGDDELLWSLNQGLFQMKENGVYDQLYEKWFTVYEHTSFFKKYKVLIYSVAGIVLVLILFVIVLRLQVRRAVRKAKRAEISFEKLILNAPVGITVSNNKFKTLLLNNAFINLTGYSPDDIPTADEWWRLAYPDEEYRNRTKEIWLKHLSGLSNRNTCLIPFEANICCKDGTYKTVEISFTEVTDELIVMTYVDLTQRKKAEQKLVESMEEMDRFFRSSLDLFCIAEKNGRLVRLNPEWEKVLGYSVAELEGSSFMEYISPEDKVTALKAFSQLEQHKEIESITSRLRCKEGQIRWIEWRARLVGDKIYAGARDVTEKVQASLALSASEEKYRLITENASDAIWIYNLYSKKFTFVSPSYYALRGFTPIEISTQSLDDTIAPEFMPLISEKIEKTVAEFLIYNDTERTRTLIEIQQPRKDGSLVWVEVSAHLQFNTDGHIEIIGVSRNIEQRKAMEAEILESEKTLRELNITKDKLLTIIAHDLKNPFSSIIGFSDLMLDEAEELSVEDVRSYSKMINSASMQAYQLLENLLQWARMQQGSITFNPTTFNLHELVNGVFAILKESAIRKEIELDNQVEEEISIFADHNMINTVVRNLVSNAVKFTNTGGKIKVSAMQSPGVIQMAVEDTGLGIAPDDLSKLFSLIYNFTRPGTANEKGTGLGLILCKDFIEKHDGQIHVKSTEGVGSSFSFTLPQNSLPHNKQVQSK